MPGQKYHYLYKTHYGSPPYDLRKMLARVLQGGIIFVNHNGLRWRDVPKEHDPHKTLYNLVETVER